MKISWRRVKMTATTRVAAAASHWGAALNCCAMSRPPLSGRTVHLKRPPAEVFGGSTSRSRRLRYGDTDLEGRRPLASYPLFADIGRLGLLHRATPGAPRP